MSQRTRFSVFWFSAAVVLTTATQLRVPGLPVGVGEGLLLGWLAVTWSIYLLRPVLRVPVAARVVLLFWVAGMSLQLLGWLVKLLLGIRQDPSAYHSFAALGFSAATICTFLLQPRLEERALLGMKVLVVMAVVPLTLLLFGGIAGLGFGPVDVWFAGVRFRGWAENPNQIGLLVAPIPFLCLFLLSTSPSRANRLAWAILAAAAVVVGLASLSDSLILGWAVGGAALMLLAWIHLVRQPQGGYVGRGFALVVLPVATVALLLPLLYLGLPLAQKGFERFYLTGGGPLRIAILDHAFQAMARSPLVGLGPGAHSGKESPFQGYESHNTFVEWGTNTGLLGTVILLGLVWWVWARTWRGGERLLLPPLIVLLIFSLFHVTFRQPSFWFFLVLIPFVGRAAGRARLAPTTSGYIRGARRGEAAPALPPAS